jgi:hypothetical protein
MPIRCLAMACIVSGIVACSDSQPTPTQPPGPAELTPVGMERVQGDQQRVPAGTMAPQEVVVQVSTGNGRGVEGVPVSFWVGSGGGWITNRQEVLTDERGRASTWWYMGPSANGLHTVVASSPYGGLAVRADVESLEPGSHHLGAEGFVELHVGTLPLILSVPRGGELEPEGLPDREGVVAASHRFTRELAFEVVRALEERGWGTPTLVVSNLSPLKVDPDVAQPAGAVPHSPNDRAWREFHGFLAAARADVGDRFGRGLLLDLQGANPEEGLVQFGYLLTAQDLDRADMELNGEPYVLRTSVRALVNENSLSLAATLRGARSLGGLLEARGFDAAPSPSHPSPNGVGYRAGGLSTAVYGSSSSGRVSAVSVETPFYGVRDTPESRVAFAEALVDTLGEFFEAHMGQSLRAELWADR